MNNLADKISQAIKEQAIKPKPKWNFTIKEILIWLFIVICLLIIGLLMAVNWEIIYQQQVSLLFQKSHDYLMLLKTVPYFWLLLCLGLAIFTYYEFCHTKSGYKINFIYFVSGIMSLTLILSGIFYFAGVGELVEAKLEQQESYHYVVMVPKKNWSQPELGILGGKIIDIKNPYFILNDWNEENWLIKVYPDTIIKPNNLIMKGEYVRLLGEIEDEHSFKAIIIMPWYQKQKNCLNECKHR
ncbi:MAG: hypothetical protein V1898_01070 [Patescibacteria group bacterium]